ncbi:MAG: hypothetical protein PHS96_15375, partial [Anaerolineales bacterium]|nr:hypothetical protein [Anaerolineales bacterium]
IVAWRKEETFEAVVDEYTMDGVANIVREGDRLVLGAMLKLEELIHSPNENRTYAKWLKVL